MKEKIFKLSVLLGLILGGLSMFLCLSSAIDSLHDDVRVLILGEYNTTCVPQSYNGQTIFVCSNPRYSELKDYLESTR